MSKQYEKVLEHLEITWIQAFIYVSEVLSTAQYHDFCSLSKFSIAPSHETLTTYSPSKWTKQLYWRFYCFFASKKFSLLSSSAIECLILFNLASCFGDFWLILSIQRCRQLHVLEFFMVSINNCQIKGMFIVVCIKCMFLFLFNLNSHPIYCAAPIIILSATFS